MSEKKLGLIPRVVVQGALGPKDYGILCTNERFIFIRESTSLATLGYFIGGIIGSAIADSAKSRKEVDYFNEPIEVLSTSKDAMTVSYSSILSIQVRRRFSEYNLNIDYYDSNRRKKIRAIITPPDQFVTQKKTEGVRLKDIRRAYAEDVWKAFEKVLPLGVAQKVEVKI
ncbi:MAG: hypothetical protein QXE18_00445 [Thermoplasmata archaeon]